MAFLLDFTISMFRFGHYKKISGDFDMAETSTFAIDKWYHVAFVRSDGVSHKIYVNGVLEAETTCAFLHLDKFKQFIDW